MKLLRNVFVIGIMVTFWYLASRHSNPLFLPRPETVWNDLVELAKNGMLGRSAWMSFYRITTAIVLAAVVSIPIGLLVATYKGVDNIVSTILSTIRYIPVTVFYPLLIMWLGIEETMKVTFLFVAAFFFFVPSVILAVKETPKALVDTAYTMGMPSWRVMITVLFPYSLPAICENFLLAYGIGWTYVIIVEIVNCIDGLGHLINIGSARGRTDLVFAAVLVIILLSVLTDCLGKWLVKRSFPWKFAREISD